MERKSFFTQDTQNSRTQIEITTSSFKFSKKKKKGNKLQKNLINNQMELLSIN